MNIVRLLKLKQLNGEFDALSYNEKKFISLFNNLKQKPNAFYDKETRLKYSDKHVRLIDDMGYYHFDFNFESGSLWCDPRVIQINFDLQTIEFEKMVDGILKNYLELENFKVC